MIINSTPDNKATLGGVASVSEFRIRNSAKAFGILSSGLYANKIRAIIRELGCNAVDSHVAAGKADVPFDLHLPTQLRPYFSIRDYGTGLAHSDVTNIYTTYFESTKTESNDFIGALGLGSKSPFSYTDNFTVVAIKNGIKGIYSAFINDDGVPAVALMGQDTTDEPDGVEVKFAVTEHDDFYKFAREASSVFTYFPVKPNFTGAEVDIQEVEYKETDIVPGIRQREIHSYNNPNRAIMGNIAYPIDIPTKQNNLGELTFIDDNGLDIYFAIGEIEFQASREGLQYTEATLDAIRAKYQAVADVLYDKLAKEADEIENLWERARYVLVKANNRLWSEAAVRYAHIKKVPFTEKGYNNRINQTHVKLDPKVVEKDFNIRLRAFETDSNYGYSSSSSKLAREVKPRYDHSYELTCSEKIAFVQNPKNEKIWERAKWHFKNSVEKNRTVYVLFAANEAQPVKFDEFFKFIHNPPADTILEVADLTKPEKIKVETEYRKVSLLRIKIDHYNSDMTWQPETVTPKDMDPNTTYCYIPIKGYVASTKDDKTIDAKEAYRHMLNSGIKSFANINFYGVRKDDLEVVKSLPNWKLFDDFINDELKSLTSKDFLGMAVASLDKNNKGLYYNKRIMERLDPKSPMRLFSEKLPTTQVDGNHHVLELAKMLNTTVDVAALEQSAKEEFQELMNRYSMIRLIRGGYYDDPAVAEYIQIVDQQKGLN